MDNTTAYDPHSNPDCIYVEDYHINLRFWLNVVFGVTLSIICIVFNTFVFLVFATNHQHRKSPNLYMLLLAFFDVFMGVSYMMVMSVRVLYNYTGSIGLKWAWSIYMVPMLTVSQVAITASTYLITFAAIERYCTSVDNVAVPTLQKHRKIFAFIAVMCGVVSKGTWIMEIATTRDEACLGTFNEWIVVADYLTKIPMFNDYFRFYFRTIFTVLAPFFILLLLNISLIFRLQKQRRIERMEHIAEKESVKQKKARIIAVTRTLVIIVCTYLMSNILGVVIAFWEFFHMKSLTSEQFQAFYVLSVDWISVFTILASCLRLPIYAIVQPILRAEMKQFIAQCWTTEKLSRRMTLIENLQLPLPQTILQQQDSTDMIEFV